VAKIPATSRNPRFGPCSRCCRPAACLGLHHLHIRAGKNSRILGC
jgi:hypothetical protein